MTAHTTYSCDACGAVFETYGVGLREYQLRLTDPDTPHQGQRMHICRLCASRQTAANLKKLLEVLPSLEDKDVWDLWTETVPLAMLFIPEEEEDEEAVE